MSKENKTLDNQQNGNDFIADVMRFYFKVNNSKLQDESRLKKQIEKVIKRLVERNNIHSESVELSFGTVDDDFVFDRCRLRISFNCV